LRRKSTCAAHFSAILFDLSTDKAYALKQLNRRKMVLREHEVILIVDDHLENRLVRNFEIDRIRELLAEVG
jgi:hypothetical protein